MLITNGLWVVQFLSDFILNCFLINLKQSVVKISSLS